MKFEEFAQINPKVSLKKDGIYDFVEMADVLPGTKYVSSKQKRSLKGSGSKFGNGDTLFARITPCLENGKIAQVKNLNNGFGFGSTEFFVFRGKKGVSDNDYVYYLSLTESIRGPAEKSMTGASGRQRADIGAIKDVEVPELSVDFQRDIAVVLSAYDNLIENNNRRIAILEEMAQSLYREWFVKFRFPEHESCKFKDSPLGEIPEGWEVKPAANVIDINPRTTMPKEGVKPFVPMTSLSESSMIISDIEEREGNSGTKFRNRDTLFARITPCLQNGKIGYVQFLNERNPLGFGSTEFIVLRESILPSEYIYCLARSNTFRSHAINSMAGADGRQRVKSDCFFSYNLAVPPQSLLDEFSGIAKFYFAKVYNLNRKNKNLRMQRDSLLPMLISGKINLVEQ